MRKSEHVVIKLNGGVEVEILKDFKHSSCKCGKRDIVWAITARNKKTMPIRKDSQKGWISHFEDCPLASKFRRRNQNGNDN